MKNTILIFCSILFLLPSCSKDEQKIEDNKGDIFGFQTVEEAKTHLGIYADIFSSTNGSMYIRSTKFGNNNGEQAEIFGRFRERSNQPPSNGGEYQFGDLKLSFDETTQTYLPQGGTLSNDEKLNRISNLFGNQNRFTLIKNGISVLDFQQYVPSKLQVNVENAVNHQGSNLKAIERDKVEITWNKDNSNENGIIAYLWWNGDRTDVSVYDQGEGDIINRAVKIDELGQSIISQELFEGIPKNAIVTLFFIRGNIELREVEGESFKFYSVTQDKHNLIMLN